MSRSVLFIAGDAPFQALMAPLLQRRGYRIDHARTAEEGRAAIALRQPTLVVLDERLPDGDATAWVHALRQDGDATPVILLATDTPETAAPRLGRDVESVAVVRRPVLPSVFLGVLERLTVDRPDASTEVDEELRALRRDYALRVPGMLQELAEAVRVCRGAPADPALCDRAIGLAHTLRGTLGTYGFSEIGVAVGNVEDALVRILRQQASTGADDWLVIGSWLDDAREWASRLRDPEMTPVPFPAPRSARATLARILLVGGEPTLAGQVARAGEAQRVRVVAAADVEGALALSREQPPDAAIIALAGPLASEQDAFSLAQALRSLPGAESMPVALLTSDLRLQGRVPRDEPGATVFVPRPGEPRGYGAVLRQLVALRQAERSHVLVLDDDPSFTAYIAAVLSHAGMLATQLHRPDGLFEVLEETQPDLVMMDVRMPGATGFELCQQLRATPRWRDLPILFLTATRDVESRVAAFQAGADDFLDKPVVAEELLARVKVRVERARLLRRVREERARADQLLLNVLPKPIAHRLQMRPGPIADRYGDVTVLFADIVNFTSFSARTTPERMVALLNDVFTLFDQLANEHGLEKIKTIGDAYMVAGGLPVPRADHAEAVAEMALGMLAAVRDYEVLPGEPLLLRVGISSGPVVAGVIGERKFIFDVWGDTVNTASRMESDGLAGRIQVSEVTWELLRDRFVLEPRGPVEVKGKGTLSTYLLVGKQG